MRGAHRSVRGLAIKGRPLPPADRCDHRLRDLHARSRRRRDELESGRPAIQGLSRHLKSSASISRAFYTDEDRKAGLPARALETAAREGKFEEEGWRVRKDGTTFWAYVVIDPIRDPDGHLIGFAKITRDLTERRRPKRSCAKSEEQFRLLVQGVTDYAIYMLDPEARHQLEFGAQRIKGYSPDEIIGQHFSRFYTEEDRQGRASAGARDRHTRRPL